MPTDKVGSSVSASLVSGVRECLQTAGVAAYFVPSEDPHQSEYTPHCHKRREALSGFTGSSGTAVLTGNHAALWTDGRYFLQAEQQLDPKTWTLQKQGLPTTPTPAVWLSKVLPKGSRVGVDATLISKRSAAGLEAELKAVGLELVCVDGNLVDRAWHNRPQPPRQKAFVHPIEYSGCSHQEKIKMVRDQLRAEGAHAFVVSALDEVAWLFNLRGNDVDFNPVFLSYALITEASSALYIDAEQVDEQVRQHLGQEVEVKPYNQIFDDLKALNAQKKKVWIDPIKGNFALFNCVDNDLCVDKWSPITLAKALKNNIEIEGMKQCHIRDAAALISYFAWLEGRLNAGDDTLTEVSVADKLEEFRKQQKDYVSLSFDTISSSGPNGAIIHYKPEVDTCAKVLKNRLYLCDSGGQYRDGTTDVTRTIHFGEPTPHEKRCYTRVLQGVIALDSAVFPEGTTGRELDTLARLPLWSDGLDYRHGTGHGVGAFLNVHEGPHGISFRDSPYRTPLQANMTVTNEPGYYEDGAFGIRIENVEIIVPVETKHKFGGKQYFGFEPITLVPLQAKMIETSLLNQKEIEWINSYHRKCNEKVSPLLSGPALEWLQRESQPLKIQ